MSMNRGGQYPLPSIRQQLGPSLGHHSPPGAAPAPSQAPPMAPAPLPLSSEARPVSSGGSHELVGNDGVRSYQLIVGQQPNRARMCGFGDKDRRPITPPPCVQVVVKDLATGVSLEPNDLSYQHFILHVDLWSEDGSREVSMVKHSTHAGSASAGILVSFEDALNPNVRVPFPNTLHYGGPPPASARAGFPPPAPAYNATSPTTTQNYGYPSPVARESVDMGRQPPVGPGHPYSHLHQSARNSPARISLSQPGTACTRNLVGNGAMSAQRLIGTDDKPGMWFVLQDLSVRTEGTFRLRFTFINALRMDKTNPTGISDPDLLNKTKCRILAYKFSEPFQVFSAKKFPGVCESTELSRKFATQGVKIPIRKDGEANKDDKTKGKKRRRGDDGEDEGEDDDFED